MLEVKAIKVTVTYGRLHRASRFLDLVDAPPRRLSIRTPLEL